VLNDDKATKSESLMPSWIKSKHCWPDRKSLLLIGGRKDKDVGQVFGRGFSWDEALDSVADVYMGVRDAFSTFPTSVLIEP
jgi:hypothetical protein